MFDFLTDTQKKKRFLFSYATFFLNGMLALSIGSLLPCIRESRGLDYGFCGMIVSLHSVGNLFASFFAGMLPVLIGRKKSILLFNSAYALSYLLILVGNAKIFFVLAFVLTGLARGATSNYCNTEINSLAPGRAWMINGLHAMFSMGAFLFPILLMFLTTANASNWIYAVYLMCGLGVLSWLLYYFIPVESVSGENLKKPGERQDKKREFGFFKAPMFWLTTSVLFFYLCAEQGVIGWLVTYFEDTGLLRAGLSQLMASILWIMILAGRLTAAWASMKFPKQKILTVMGVGITAFYLLLICARSTWLIVVGIMGFGYSMAGIYPTAVSFNGELIARYRLAWSFILTMASFGSVIMPSVIGWIAQKRGLIAGMSSVAVVVFIELVCILFLAGYVEKKRDKK